MLIPLYRCLVTFGALWLFLTVLWVGLQCVIVVFPDHTHLLFSYSSIILIKIQQKSRTEVFRGVGGEFSCNSLNIEYKSFGILTSTVWSDSVVAGHVVISIHRVHSLEINRAGSIPRQILVLSGLVCSV